MGKKTLVKSEDEMEKISKKQGVSWMNKDKYQWNPV